MPYHETSWFEWLVLAVVVAIGVVLLQLMEPTNHYLYTAGLREGLHYLEIAQSLAQGRGFQVLTLPPILGFSTPPVYPLLLAGVMRLVEANTYMEAMRAFHSVNWVLYGFSVFLVQFFLRRSLPKAIALIISALYALAPVTLVSAAGIHAGMAYIVLCLLAMLAIDRVISGGDAPPTRWDWVQIVGLLALAALTKHIGWTLIAAFLILCLRRLGVRPAMGFLGILLVLLLPWTLREVLSRQIDPRMDAALERQEQFLNQESRVVSPFTNTRRFYSQTLDNVKTALEDTTEGTLGKVGLQKFDGVLTRKLYLNSFEFRLSDVAWVRWILGGLIALGTYVAFSVFSGIGSVYLVAYLLATVLLPVEKTHLMLPVLPWLLQHLYLGLLQLGSWFERMNIPLGRVAIPAMTMLIGLNNFNGFLDEVRDVRLMKAQGLTASASTRNPSWFSRVTGRQVVLNEAEQGYMRALAWVGEHTPTSAALVTRKPNAASYYTQRATRPYPKVNRRDRLVRELAQADYIIEERQFKSVRQRLSPVLEQNPGKFRKVYEDTPSRIRIWQVLGANAGGDTPLPGNNEDGALARRTSQTSAATTRLVGPPVP